METKQVIAIRRDLGMRRGKECAQSSHASMSFLTRSMKEIDSEGDRDKLQFYELVLSQEEKAWLDSSYAKICCRVDSEQELLDLVEKAKAAGLTVHLVQDAGKTEFNGVPTYTCAAIGPHSLEKFEGITSHLKLY